MANDDTLYRNVENENVQEKNEKKSTVNENLKMAGAAAAGAAVGSAASMGAQAAINHYAAEETVETAEAEGVEGTEEGDVEALATEAPAEPQPQVVHHYHNTEVHHHHHHQAAASHASASQAPAQQGGEEQVAQNTPEQPLDGPDQNIQQTANEGEPDIRVIGVEHDVNMNGQDVDVAVISVEGHHGLLVDVDQEGTADIAVLDVDDSGTISENEVMDISGQGIAMPQQTSGDDFIQASDDMPDYTNDAILA